MLKLMVIKCPDCLGNSTGCLFSHSMFFVLSLKYSMVYYFDVSSGLAKIKLFLFVCNHTENTKQLALSEFGRCFILA